MLGSIKKKIFQSEPFVQLAGAISGVNAGDKAHVRSLGGSLLAFAAALLYEKSGRQIVLIVPESDRAEKLRDDCSLLLGPQNVRLYARGADTRATLLDMTSPLSQVETLRSLSRSENVLVITSAEGLAQQVLPPGNFRQRSLEISVGMEQPFEALLKKLAELGFERKDFVEEYGDFAVRGGILDVYPFVGDHPVRMEFWGDSVESLREFDVLSQRSIRELQTANIVASLTSDFTDGADSTQIADNADLKASLFDYLQQDALLFVDEPALIQKEIEELRNEGVQNIFEWPALEQLSKKFPRVIHSAFENQHSLLIDFLSAPQPPINGSIKVLVRHLQELTKQGYKLYLACDTQEEGTRLKELIEEEITSPEPGQPPAQSNDDSSDNYPTDALTENVLETPALQDSQLPTDYQFVFEAIHSGFIYQPAKIALFTEHEIFGRLKRRGSGRKTRFKGFSLKEAQQLKRGDFVVHEDYGIGKFAGLQKIKVRGAEQEVMKILYDENDTLYVNLNFVNRVQKYSSQEGHVPKLTKLGAPDWERLKSRARKRIKDIARELIALYARRKHEKGFAFSADAHWQKEMEASFMYEDTPDQAKATLDVKQDMENLSPMDRLICGDVGFGKTEVAVRAAFKAVLDGKQAAVLVPTTILAHQHCNTFLDRLGRYSVRVESLTRFKSKKEQKAILEALAEGRVDIVIGTHRLLSKDVQFKSLGLLVIDEEHRFGVTAKEKLRQLRATVDTLTLTATPIPRTLHFSLMGARDLSIINTPPRNRLPIITEIAQYDIGLIREAILKELHRGGQIYFVHDRVQNMELIRTMLEEHIPEARFHTAHGQMKGHELEQTMMDFLEKKYNVLICTKIIESGIDIPSVNTIIINRADRFGLAELYQLRGRVGRSNEQAYAYLITPPISSMPRASLRRLQAIQEFTELGSGFNLAMRDLEIRGAGNLLGAEQSGFIMQMGFEAYQRIVEEAVNELKEQEFAQLFEGEKIGKKRQTETIIETDIEALIPDFYIESDSERLDIYRRLYKLESFEEIQAMREELQDRFGEYPEEVEHLFRMVEVKTLAAKLRFTKVELTGDSLTLSFPPNEEKEFYEGADGTVSSFQTIMNRVTELKQYQARLKQEGQQLKLVARVERKGESLVRLAAVRAFLEKLI